MINGTKLLLPVGGPVLPGASNGHGEDRVTDDLKKECERAPGGRDEIYLASNGAQWMESCEEERGGQKARQSQRRLIRRRELR